MQCVNIVQRQLSGVNGTKAASLIRGRTVTDGPEGSKLGVGRGEREGWGRGVIFRKNTKGTVSRGGGGVVIWKEWLSLNRVTCHQRFHGSSVGF